MSAKRYTPEFKAEAVKQITERGYAVAEVAKRLGVTTHSLYAWLNSIAVEPGGAVKIVRGMRYIPCSP